jgi:diguanylate cyclase (GGDEF)-like protein
MDLDAEQRAMTLPSRVAMPILSTGGLIALFTLAVPGYVHPTWWARTAMVVIGLATLTVGAITTRRPLTANWLISIALGADLAIVVGAASVSVNAHACLVFYALTSVVVALYATRRIVAVQAVISAVCCGTVELLVGASPISAIFQAVAICFATISPAVAVLALRSRLEASTAAAHKHAGIDPLTQACNRRGLENEIPSLLARHERTGLPVGVAVVDIDHFKQVNDVFGHTTGDIVIQQVCDAVRSCVRAEDVIVRLGGEEFAVVLLLPPDDLTALGERIRRRIAEHCADRSVTASIGITWSPPGVTWASRSHSGIWQLVDHADTLMYEAKRAGRNRVCASVHA